MRFQEFDILKFSDIKSSGVEIYPIPRGIIFNILGFPVCVWGVKSNKSDNFETSNLSERKSAGVEIDPTPRGIIFNILGFPGGHKSTT